MKIRLVSWNIHKGFSPFNGRFVLDGIRELIRLSRADLVFLQEVQGEHTEKSTTIEGWPTQAQFEFLADQVWSHFTYGKNAIYPAGHHGNAILSHFPIASWENIDLSVSRLEKRGMLHARVVVPDTRIDFDLYCTHLNLFGGDRKIQVDRITREIRMRSGAERALILAGDFNDWRDQLQDTLEKKLGLREAFRTHRGALARTFPSFAPILPLDRVYLRGFEVLATTRSDPPSPAVHSDHLPLEVDAYLRDPRS